MSQQTAAIAREQAVLAYHRYQEATTDKSRNDARDAMLAWHHVAMMEDPGSAFRRTSSDDPHSPPSAGSGGAAHADPVVSV